MHFRTVTLLTSCSLAAGALGALGCGDTAGDDPSQDAAVLRDATADASPVDSDGSPADAGAQTDAAPDAAPCVDDPPAVGAPLAELGNCGRLVYGPYANRDELHADNRLPDFSYAGYQRGGVALPHVPAVETVSNEPGLDGDRIQAAVDAVSALPPDANGFRGAVLLTAGTFRTDAPIRIETSGVVLRGEGQGTDGTLLRATAAHQYTLIEVHGGGAPEPVSGTTQRIAEAYVPVGATSFRVEDAAALAVGDRVAVRRTPNAAWVAALDLEAFWTASSYHIAHERILTAVDPQTNRVTVDLPLVDAMAHWLGGGEIERLDDGARIEQVGVEDLRLESVYDGAEDEDHAWTAIELSAVENAWVQRITALHFGKEAVLVTGGSQFVTVQDSAMLEPVSILTGGRRYPFHVDDGLGVLFQRCYTHDARHSFVTGSRVTGPHVWLDCLGEATNNDDGPHHRWATGLLFDNTRSAELRVQNRYDSGSGHGWSGAQVMFWNCDVTDHFVCDAPSGAMNWAVGVTGTLGDGQWIPAEPPGIHESLGTPVTPRSLYLQQLEDRLGPQAVLDVTVPAQRNGRIWSELAAWAGDGAPW
jgi:hypothetical protein